MSSPMNLNMKDEATIAWKGWLIFKVHIPNKPDRYSNKAFLVSESKSGYICMSNLEVYNGKSQSVRIWVQNFWMHSCLVKDTTCTRTITITVLKCVKCCWKRKTYMSVVHFI
jgi:hypothetical protein